MGDRSRHGRRRFLARALTLVLATTLAVGGGRNVSAHASEILVFAAASLQTALDALAPDVERTTGVHMKVSYAASSALARQIENGAPADLFISADLDWMDELATKGQIRTASRVNLLTGDLVLIAPRAAAPTITIAPGFALATALGSGRLAIADPNGVPAGKYAKAALSSLGVWTSVEAKLAPAEDVRAALRLVSRGEAPLGIVYRSDAIADPGVVVVGVFPATSHPPIVYPIAITTSASDAASAAAVLAYLRSPAARTVFTTQGFGVVAPGRPAAN